jgi:uncharacterized repeat protein (TIGR03803 family)
MSFSQPARQKVSTVRISHAALLAYSRRMLAILLGTVLSSCAPWCRAQVSYETIKSFGFREAAGSGSTAPLTEGSDGALYGTMPGGGTSRRGTVFSVKKDGTGYRIVHDFVAKGFSPVDPYGGVTEVGDGVFYGTTYRGGAAGNGTIFKVNRDGSSFQVLREFGGAADGRSPVGPLAVDADGYLYGTTEQIADRYGGTVYRIRTNGTGYEILRWFTNGLPPSSVLSASDGLLYGTASLLGGFSGGHLFRMNRDGSAYAVLRAYESGSTDGGNPAPGLTEGNDGFIYGTTFGGGTSNLGTVFKLARDGNDYTVLHAFSAGATNGSNPRWGVAQAPDGRLYGTASGGATGNGVAFRVNTNGASFESLHDFNYNAGDGDRPASGVICTSEGALYGITGSSDFGNATIFKVAPPAGTFVVVRRFSRTGGDGTAVFTDLTEGDDGFLLGVTEQGGAEEVGTVFKIKKDGSAYSLLHQFSESDDDGQFPEGGLLRGSEGMLYGTTWYGGTGRNGTVFRINQDGTGYSTLHNFDSSGLNGDGPVGRLLEGSDGFLYGMTSSGGSGGRGTIFRLKKEGTAFELLCEFSGANGTPANPGDSLVEGRDGILYGTTAYGGVGNGGTLFRLNKDGSGFVVTHLFGSGMDGRWPAPIIEGTDGVLYGATQDGGSAGGGTVFKINKDGSGYSLLRSFSSANNDAWNISARLLEASDGMLYGTTTIGGQTRSGTVFRLNKDGSGYAVLVSFWTSAYDGWEPYGGLIETSDGALYGTTYSGGHLNLGTLYRLQPAPQISLELTTGGPRLRFAGQRNRTYDISRSSSVGGDWETIATHIAPATHWIEHNDTNSLSASGYYKVRRVP